MSPYRWIFSGLLILALTGCSRVGFDGLTETTDGDPNLAGGDPGGTVGDEASPAGDTGGGGDSFTPDVPTQLTMSGDYRLDINTCSNPYLVIPRDAGGTPITVTTDTVLTLDFDVSGGTFYSDAACTEPLVASQLTIRAGRDSATFHFEHPQHGDLLLSAASPGLETAFLWVEVLSRFNGSGFLTVSGVGGGSVDRYFAVDTEYGFSIAVGQTQEPSGQFRALITKINGDGTIDGTFGDNGHVVGPAGGISSANGTGDGFLGLVDGTGETNDALLAVQIQPNRTILVAGYTGVQAPPSEQAYTLVARFDENGVLDDSFGDDDGPSRRGFIIGRGDEYTGEGRMFSDPFETGGTPRERFNDFAVNAGGQVILVGSTEIDSWFYRQTLVTRFHADGASLDSTFNSNGNRDGTGTTSGYIWGNDGRTWFDSLWNAGVTYDELWDVELVDGESILAVGHVRDVLNVSNAFVARWLSDGSPDPGFDSDGFEKYGAGLLRDDPDWMFAETAVTDDDGDIYLAGTNYNPNIPGPSEPRFYLAKVSADGALICPAPPTLCPFASNSTGYYLAAPYAMCNEEEESASELIYDSDYHQIYVLGSGYSSAVGRVTQAFLAKFEDWGALDSSFHVNGATPGIIDFSPVEPAQSSVFSGAWGWDRLHAMDLDSSRRLVVVGETGTADNDIRALVMRINMHDGTIDGSLTLP